MVLSDLLQVLKYKLIQTINQTSYTTGANPLYEITKGIKLLASGISHIILLPVYYFGLSIPIIFVQLLYIGILGWIILKLIGNIKWWLIIMIFLIFISIFSVSI